MAVTTFVFFALLAFLVMAFFERPFLDRPDYVGTCFDDFLALSFNLYFSKTGI